MTRILVAHQPAYLPWGGYFARLVDVNELVLLDHVQFSERGYQHRNHIRAPRGGPLRLTVPVRRRFGQAISEVEIADPGWSRRHWRAITESYRHAPYWRYYADRLEEVYRSRHRRLLDLTTALTELFLDALEIPAAITPASALSPEGRRTDLLIDLARTRAADILRVGTGADRYLDRSALRTAGIGVEVIRYSTLAYRQGPGPFTPNLSVLDMLMWTGPRTRDLIHAGATLTREAEAA